MQGSVGMVLILSTIGIVLHFLVANYVYAMNPGKYGVRKGPFYFFKVRISFIFIQFCYREIRLIIFLFTVSEKEEEAN